MFPVTWCSQRRKKLEALADTYEGAQSKHVLLFSISKNLALLLKEAAHVSYFQNILLSAMCGYIKSKGSVIDYVTRDKGQGGRG